MSLDKYCTCTGAKPCDVARRDKIKKIGNHKKKLRREKYEGRGAYGE